MKHERKHIQIHCCDGTLLVSLISSIVTLFSYFFCHFFFCLGIFSFTKKNAWQYLKKYETVYLEFRSSAVCSLFYLIKSISFFKFKILQKIMWINYFLSQIIEVHLRLNDNWIISRISINFKHLLYYLRNIVLEIKISDTIILILYVVMTKQ